MRRSPAPLIALVLGLPLAACEAPTQHTGNRPMGTRREAPLGPETPLGERVEAYNRRQEALEAERARRISEETQRIGVGSTRRFHRPGCAQLESAPRADQVIFVSSFDALDGGYGPCDVCAPHP
jgi:hypothetical protein